jgi:CheY-like chemotaxis protein
MMPNVDGYEMLWGLQDDPVTAIIPFLFLTAKSSHDDVRKGMGLGAFDPGGAISAGEV